MKIIKKSCPICGRPIYKGHSDRHHLTPRSFGGDDSKKNIILLHRICHEAVHLRFSNKELAEEYNTLEKFKKIKEDSYIKSLIKFLKNKTPKYYRKIIDYVSILM